MNLKDFQGRLPISERSIEIWQKESGAVVRTER